MSSTNKTANYELSQYIGSDKPTYLVDYNGDMLKIDTGMAANKAQADATDLVVSGHTSSIEGLQGTVSDQGTAITGLRTDVDGNTGSINTINSLIGNGEPTTTDKTIIGAINELHADIKNNRYRLVGTAELGRVYTDGVKTFSQLIAELKVAVLATLADPANANAKFSNMTVYSTMLNFIRDENSPRLYDSTSVFDDTFNDVLLDTNGDVVVTQLNFGTASLSHNVGGTYTDLSPDTPLTGNEIIVYAIRYEKD